MSKKGKDSRFNQNKSFLERSLPIFVSIFIFLILPLIVFAISTGALNVAGNATFDENIRVDGTIIGNSNARISEGIDLIDLFQNVTFSIYIQGAGIQPLRNLPSDYNNVLVISNETDDNPENIFVVFWDAITERPIFVIQEQTVGRASVIENSLLIGHNKGVGTLDLNYTLCSGFDFLLCDTNSTGANLGVEGDSQFQGSVQIDGNAFITVPYGSMFQHDLGTILVLSNTSSFFPIDDMNSGLSNGFDLNGTDSLRVQEAGTYMVVWSISFSDLANRAFEGGITIDSVIQLQTIAEVRMGTAADQVNFGSPGIIVLDVNQLVSLELRAVTAATTVEIEEASVTLLRIGN